MTGWHKCLTDNDEVRLYNPMLLGVVTEASKTRRAYLEKKDGERERKRLEALPKQVVQAGASQRLAGDEA